MSDEKAKLDIVAMGEPMFEFNDTGRDRQWLGGFGGDTSNAAVAAARLGARVGYVTALGDDGFGKAFRELWAREGIDTSAVRTNPAAHTGVYFVTHGPKGHEFSYLRAGSAASRFGPGDLDADYLRAARVLHVSGISQAISTSACDAVFAAIAIAKAARRLVSYDTNLRLRLWPLDRARAVIEATARQADILLPGLDDAKLLTGLDDPDAICDHYLAAGIGIVGLTLGGDGAIVATPGGRERFPAIPCEPVDATGAGDAFDGAFLTAYLRTGDPFRAGRFASVAAGISTEGYGAVDPLPRLDAVVARGGERLPD